MNLRAEQATHVKHVKFYVLTVFMRAYACIELKKSSVRRRKSVRAYLGIRDNFYHGLSEVSLYTDVSLCITVGWDFALGMETLSLFANCRYIRSRY